MSLEFQAGTTYFIKSKSTDAFIGRHIREDKSLLPKSIFLLPKNFTDIPKWEMINSYDDTYILKTRGSHASNINNLLFGVLLPEPEATKWKIQAQPQYGRHVYTISVAGRVEGWVSPEGEEEQVMVRPLIVGPSEPPRYPLNELFEIIPVDYE